jgi:hypothetical protein
MAGWTDVLFFFRVFVERDHTAVGADACFSTLLVLEN